MGSRYTLTLQGRSLDLYPHQYDFVETDARQAAMVGGYGSGKTYGLCIKGLRLASEEGNPGLPGMIVSPTYRMSADIVVPSFTAMLDRFHVIYNFRKSDYKIILSNRSEVWFRSADRPHKLKGPTLAWAILDEAELMKKDVWTVCLARVRHPEAKQHFVGAVSTSGDFGWIYDTFVINHADDPNYYIQHGISTRENKSLSPEYVESLLDNMTDEEVRAYVDGEFHVSKEGKICSNFKRDYHLVDCPYEKSKVIGLGMDFNVHPATAVAFQRHTHDGTEGVAVTRFFTKPNSSTEEIAHELIEEFGKAIPIYYDFTGNARAHATGDSDKDILTSVGFKTLFTRQVRSVKDKVNHILVGLKNAKGKTRLWIAKQCVERANKQFPSIVECLENARWDENRRDFDSNSKQYSHLLDCVAYYFYNVYPIKERPQFSGGGRATGF